MGSYSVDFKVTVAPWMDDPVGRWNRGLEAAGQAWQREVSNYPPEPPGSMYGRTGESGQSAGYEIVTRGLEMNLKGQASLKFVLLGTGVFGPGGSPIGGYGKLAWTVTNPGHPLYGSLVTAFSVSGTIWAGKLQQIREAINRDFQQGVVQNR